MLIVGARNMLIVGAAPFVNRCNNMKMLIVGAQHIQSLNISSGAIQILIYL